MATYTFTNKDEIGVSLGERLENYDSDFTAHYQVIYTDEYNSTAITDIGLQASDFPVVIFQLVGYSYKGMTCNGKPLDGNENIYWMFVVDTLKNHVNTPNTNEDNISYKVPLSQGTYTLILFGKTHTAYGIVDVDIDGVEVASFDLYGANTDNIRQVQTGITVATAGIKTLRLRIDGKNPSSSNYYGAFTYIALIKTA